MKQAKSGVETFVRLRTVARRRNIPAIEIMNPVQVQNNGGKLKVVLTPAGFEKFFEEIDAMSPQQQQDIPCVMEIGKKYGLEFLPPPGV